MTLQQKAMDVMERLPDEKLAQVIQFAEFLSVDALSGPDRAEEENYIRRPGILKGKMHMADDFDVTPECFKEYM